jgi:hypothetical protein
MPTGTGIAGAKYYHPAAGFELRCWVCAGLLRSGGIAARCLLPLAIVCSEACRADPRYAGLQCPTLTP